MMDDIELKKMIETFDFDNFLNPPEEQSEVFGGWVIITDTQCAVGYNDYDGLGYHGDSVRRALCEILDVGRYSHLVTPTVSQSNYLIGTMMAGANTAYILFPLDNIGSITPNQLKLFEKFKEEYNKVIENKSEVLHQGIVKIEKEKVEYVTKNLNILYEVLSGMVDENKMIPEDVNVIGKTLYKVLSKEEKMEERCFQITPYEYLKQDIHSIKGVSIITDQQNVFYGVLRENDFRTHYGLSKDIERMIHPGSNLDLYQNHTYIFLLQDEVIINLPEDGTISQNQIDGIMSFITDIERYNQEVDEQSRISMKVMAWHGNYEPFFFKKDITTILDSMEEFVRPELDEEEVIIGKEFDSSSDNKNMVYSYKS